MVVLVKGDGGSMVVVTLTQPDGSLIDLTSKTVKLAFTIGSGALVRKDMTTLDQNASKGQASYQFAVADLNASGELEAEVVINYGLTDQLTSEKFRVSVREPKT
jgi:hypothetical protein